MVNFRYICAVVFSLVVGASAACQGKYWYKSFSGTIDKYPFTLLLHKTDHEYSGYYYYNKTQRPFSFIGEDTAIAGKIQLAAFIPGVNSDNEIFILQLAGDSLNGEWKKNSESQALIVRSAVHPSVAPVFDLVYTSGNELLRPKMDRSPHARYESVAVWPKGNTPAVSELKKTILNSMHLKGEGDIGPLMLANKKRFFADYFSEHKNVPDSELVNFTSGYSEEISTRLTIMFHSPEILTLSNMHYSYTGGAHGNYGTFYSSVNPSTGKAYPLSAVLSTSGRKLLDDLLNKHFRKDFNLTATESLKEAGLFEERITANENFFLTGSGIGFNYVPYEIGPYAMGEVTIFIPYTDFGANGLNPSFRK